MSDGGGYRERFDSHQSTVTRTKEHRRNYNPGLGNKWGRETALASKRQFCYKQHGVGISEEVLTWVGRQGRPLRGSIPRGQLDLTGSKANSWSDPRTNQSQGIIRSKGINSVERKKRSTQGRIRKKEWPSRWGKRNSAGQRRKAYRTTKEKRRAKEGLYQSTDSSPEHTCNV